MRCYEKGCKRKINKFFKDLNLCQCGHYYCKEEHLEKHSCEKDYHEQHKKYLEEDLVEARPKKLIKI